MLCFICLTEDKGEPNKAVSFVQGTSVCREHAATIDSAISALYKLREAAERIKKHREAVAVELGGNAVNNGHGELA